MLGGCRNWSIFAGRSGRELLIMIDAVPARLSAVQERRL